MSERPYLRLLEALGVEGVAFAIVGGFAAVLHGVPRMTFDLDIAVDDSDINMQRLVGVLRAQGYSPRLPVALQDLASAECRRDWTENRNLIAFSVNHGTRVMEEVDVLLVIPFSWQEVAKSTSLRTLDGVQVPVIGRALLRQMKLASGRYKDLQDAAMLDGPDA